MLTPLLTTLSLLCLAITGSFAFPTTKDADLVTEPKPGDEFVFVQSTGSDARPIARKDKVSEEDGPFETAHKVPGSLTFARKDEGVEDKKATKKVLKTVKKREANPQGAAPAPAGAIKLDVKALLKKYETELKSSTTPKPKVTSTTTKSGRRRGGASKRVKKEAKHEVTSPRPVLTTAKATLKRVDDDDDAPLLGAASEKQRSRIQIKKGPNGQEYEYEYVYYYYDDDEEPKDKKVTNSHDGPARNQITRSEKSREKTPEANEVVPSRGSKTRGRQLSEEETVSEERLPVNTRFPPRSRNLNTTPIPEEETVRAVTRGRGRGRSTTEAAPNSSSETDNVSDESQGTTRGRNRANVRRPSLDLVDSDSFSHGANSGKPSFPQDLPEGPVRFLGATPNERIELDPDERYEDDEKKTDAKDEDDDEDSSSSPTEEGTTVMSAMDKVALDLYAISQGTQKLFGEGEDGESSTEAEKTISTEENEGTTEAVTESVELETTTVLTTTTTTTTTTPAPTTTTTTTTEAAPFGRGKFGNRRNGLGGRKTTAQSTTTEAAQAETKPKSKFGRPSFGGRARPGAKTTAAPAVEDEAHKEEAKPASHSRPTLSRGRFGGSRPRGRTTATTEEPKDESSSSSTAAPSRPSLPRARPSFNLRTRGRTTAAPATEEDQPGEESSPSASTTETSTTKSRRVGGASGVRPLRPGPRINLAARGRPGASTTTTTTEAPIEDHVTGDEDEKESPDQEESEKEETPAAPVDNSPLGRLRNKNRINVQNRPKAAASAPVQVRRVNPLIARRRPGQTTEAPSSEAPQESPATEEAEAAEEESTEAAPSSSTTEEPKGLNKLLAGRRRPGLRTPGTLTHRT
ncbi:hypothetical protein NQ315_005553 [Exocentrus adspersus]|uniref:Uncharacterized protein n=1 Tax=Exocentrus adspersus TaxID=1586481 RepID=A0AAV8VTY6_9CUCU|nr:hypothetical protein NQ315_005553 [Exocentrus adspersus]